MGNLSDRLANLIGEIEKIECVHERTEAINQIRLAIHNVSPFKEEPVDCVLWIQSERVEANDYNPNGVAPPEMKLLTQSIKEDHLTQPIVTWENGCHYEVVDGFHRNLVSRNAPISDRLNGYLPVSVIHSTRTDRNDRIAATIRHNRARGKHQVEKMSDIVVELHRRNWSDKRIAQELGMTADEVLRLKQITGLASLFENKEFSEAWEINL